MDVDLRLYLDEDVSPLLGELLKSRGYDCISALELGRRGWADERHLEAATRDERVVLTHNREDFMDVSVEWNREGRSHAGIVLMFRRSTVYELASQVLAVLPGYDQKGWIDTIAYA